MIAVGSLSVTRNQPSAFLCIPSVSPPFQPGAVIGSIFHLRKQMWRKVERQSSAGHHANRAFFFALFGARVDSAPVLVRAALHRPPDAPQSSPTSTRGTSTGNSTTRS